MNTITPNNLINFEGKVNTKRVSLFDSRKICDFKVEHPTLDELNISTKVEKCRGESKKFRINIANKYNMKIAHEDFNINKKENELYGIIIKTSENYRKNNLAEILRLGSIITMLKNGIKNFRILSLDTAVLFHTKYKFEPDITNRKESIRILKHLTNSDNEQIVEKAQTILDKKHLYSEKEICTFANKIAKDFFVNELKTTGENTLDFHGIDMKLTEEKIKENKDFFNQLFEKHNIDFRV